MGDWHITWHNGPGRVFVNYQVLAFNGWLYIYIYIYLCMWCSWNAERWQRANWWQMGRCLYRRVVIVELLSPHCPLWYQMVCVLHVLTHMHVVNTMFFHSHILCGLRLNQILYLVKAWAPAPALYAMHWYWENLLIVLCAIIRGENQPSLARKI